MRHTEVAGPSGPLLGARHTTALRRSLAPVAEGRQVQVMAGTTAAPGRQLKAAVGERGSGLGLSVKAMRLLDVCAVLGRSFSVDNVAEVIGKPVGRLLQPLREVLDAGVLEPEGGILAFRHEAVQTAVYESIGQPFRLALHRRIGGLLLNRNDSIDSVARHLVVGARPGDGRDVALLDRAARQALPMSAEAAAGLALRALELSQTVDDGYFHRAVMAVDALVAARQLTRARQLVSSTLARPGGPVEATARLHLALSSILLMSGQPAECVAQADAVISQAGLPAQVYDAADEARLLGLMTQGQLDLTRDRAGAILAGDQCPHRESALSAALTALAIVAWSQGRLADAIGLLRAAVQRSDREEQASFRMCPLLTLATVLLAVGQFDEAGDLINRAEQEVRLGRGAIWAPGVPMVRARLHVAAGRLDEGQADAEAGLALADQMGAGAFVPFGEWMLACVALLRNDLEAATRHVERYQRQPTTRQAPMGPTYALTEAWLIDIRDGPNCAFQRLGALYDDPATQKQVLVVDPTAAAFLVRVALTVDDRRRAEAVVVAAEFLAGANQDFPSLVAAAVQARALLDPDMAGLKQAAATHRLPWAAASATEDMAALLAETNPDAGAEIEQALSQCLADYEQIGACHDAERVRERLRRLGHGNQRRHRDRRPVSGWPSLTDTQLKVADLVAQGLTNPEVARQMFLSRHTVDFHLRQIYRKLAIGSRVELTRLSIERDRMLGVVEAR